MKENVIKEAHRYKKQTNDFIQSNLFKTIVNMKALSNQAAGIFRKAKHVLNPEKINVLLKKTYEDVVKGPLVRTKMGMGRMVDAVMNTPISRALSFNGPMDSDTLRDVAKNAGDTIVNASKSVERVVGDVSGKIGEVMRNTSENTDIVKFTEEQLSKKTSIFQRS